MKNKSSLLVITALCVLCAISFWLYKNKTSGSTLNKDARNFAVEDTSVITKIFLADKDGKSVTVEKKGNAWIVNGKYPARPDAISLLLYTMKMVDVKSPVSKAAREAVIKRMATSSIKVEIYEGEELIKQYYVGHESLDNDGSYMILTNLSNGENYDEPYLTFIPGFTGFLAPRYITDESEWRDRVVVNYIPPNLKTIKLELAENPDSSFVINLKSTTQFELKKLNGQDIAFDESKMKQYLAYFQNISYEKLLTNFNKKLCDSLRSAMPYMKLTITDTKNETKVFNFLHKNSTFEINKKYGIDYKYDPDRCFMRYDNDKEVALVQFYVFGKLLPTYVYFLPKNTVKK